MVRIIGDLDNPVYHGYSCVKGRNYHEFHRDPGRVLHPLQPRRAGQLQRVAPAAAFAGIAGEVGRIVAAHGPRAVAMYAGTFSHFCPAGVMLRDAFMDALGSPMRFTNATIDQPGKPISMALHGRWGAGPQAFADADVCLLVGANPLVSMWGGIPSFNPAKRLHEARARGPEADRHRPARDRDRAQGRPAPAVPAGPRRRAASGDAARDPRRRTARRGVRRGRDAWHRGPACRGRAVHGRASLGSGRRPGSADRRGRTDVCDGTARQRHQRHRAEHGAARRADGLPRARAQHGLRPLGARGREAAESRRAVPAVLGRRTRREATPGERLR